MLDQLVLNRTRPRERHSLRRLWTAFSVQLRTPHVARELLLNGIPAELSEN